MNEYTAFKEWTCVFPGKGGLCWKRAWDCVGSREEAEAQAAKNCNVVAVPVDLWENINYYQKQYVVLYNKLEVFYKTTSVELSINY